MARPCRLSMSVPENFEKAQGGFPVRILFQNIRGLISKRSKIISSELPDHYDIFLFQESLTTKEHALVDDWSQANCIGKILSYRNSEEYRQGMFLAYKNHLKISYPKIPALKKRFEISVMKLSAPDNAIYLVLAYRSPSMKPAETEDYFENLCDVIESIEGNVALFGDLNLKRGRKFRGGLLEDAFLEMIEDTGLESRVVGITHGNSQLDYCFSNFQPKAASIVTSDISDHNAISMTLELGLQPKFLETTYVPRKGWVYEPTYRKALSNLAWRIKVALLYRQDDPNTCVGRFLAELDVLLWNLDSNCNHYRKIPAHYRIPGCSRQMSRILLDQNLEPDMKTKLLKQNLALDAKRHLLKRTSGESKAEALYALFSLATKNNSVACDLDPEGFREKIVNDEALVDHTLHSRKQPLEGIIKKTEEVNTDEVASKLRKNFLTKHHYSKKLWSIMAALAFTPYDRGYRPILKVETVVKDKDALDTIKGWRLVWKSTSIPEKCFDSIKTSWLHSTKIPNNAYTEHRSCLKCLAQVASWCVPRGKAIAGVDFRNAFAECCRECTNDILGTEVIPKNIDFFVCTSHSETDTFTSTVGTGAGRATGGPTFNITANTVRQNLESKANVETDELADYADDAEIIIDATPEKMQSVLDCYEDASDVGLTYHPHPSSKGPQVLVHKEDYDDLKITLGNLANVCTTISFLGLDQSLEGSRTVFHVKPKIFSKLAFYSRELIRGLNVACFDSDTIDSSTWKAAAESVASFIENRIQYYILFVDQNCVNKLLSIHRYVVAGLLGFRQIYFGFKRIRPCKPTFPNDLYQAIDKHSSSTYLLLCKIAGRPSLFDMAARAANVVIEQTDLKKYTGKSRLNSTSRLPPFMQRIIQFQKDLTKFEVQSVGKISGNKFHKNYASFNSRLQRKVFVKMLTGRFLLADLQERGFDVSDKSCRLCNDGSVENSAHFFKVHVPELLRTRNDPKQLHTAIAKRKIPDALTSAATPARKRPKPKEDHNAKKR